MLRLSRRCKLLVSLLLLCGCFLSFSLGNAFASSVSYFPGDTSSASYVIDGGLQVEYRVSSEYPYTEYQDLTSIQSSSAYAWFDGFVNDYFSVNITNSNDYPVTNNKGFFELWATVDYTAELPDGLTVSRTPSIKLGDMNNCFVGIIGSTTEYTSASCLTIKPNDNYLIDGKFVLMPHESYTFSFSVTRCNTFNTTGSMTAPIPQYITAINNFLNQAEATVGNFTYAPTSTFSVIGSSAPSVLISNPYSRLSVPIQDSNGSELGFVEFFAFDSFIRDSSSSSADGITYETGSLVINSSIFLRNSSGNIISVNSLNGILGMPSFSFLNVEGIPVSNVTFKLVEASFEEPFFFRNSNNSRISFGVSSPPKVGSSTLLDKYSFSSCNVEFVFEYSFSYSSIYDSVPYDISATFSSLTFNDNAPAIIASSRPDLSSTDSSTNLITGELEQQQQQQQQQHEEQMEQSQQQYDDFTDSGSSDGSDLIAGTEEDLKEKIGIFTFLDNLIQRFLGLFVASDASTSITLPAFSMNIQGRDYQIWEEYTFDLSSLDGPFNVLMTAVRFATVATVYFAFLGYLQKTYKRIIGGSNG